MSDIFFYSPPFFPALFLFLKGSALHAFQLTKSVPLILIVQIKLLITAHRWMWTGEQNYKDVEVMRSQLSPLFS